MLTSKYEKAIERIKYFEPEDGYYFANSGGKDSCVVRDLLTRSGVKFDSHHNLTTVDHPELIYFIKKHHTETIIHKPAMSMWQLIVKKRMPPTRLVRYCCDVLKERGGNGRMVVTGIRWDESSKRKKRTLTEICTKRAKRYLHPIIDWSEEDVWNYMKSNNIPYCKLYDEGYKRLGCIMCPIASIKARRFEKDKNPKYYQAYLRAFQRCIDKRIKDGLKTTWTTGQEMMDWWLSK